MHVYWADNDRFAYSIAPFYISCIYNELIKSLWVSLRMQRSDRLFDVCQPMIIP